jgi:putative transposase
MKRNKYKNKTIRLETFNYSSPAKYFLTLITKNRKRSFGKIINGNMILSKIGCIAEEEWKKTPSIRPEMNIELGAYVVMPDHFHAVLIIGSNIYNENNSEIKNKFKPQSNNLAAIIRGFKSSVTTFARKNDIDFSWQPRFYERIIRNDRELLNVSQYIENNPSKWDS